MTELCHVSTPEALRNAAGSLRGEPFLHCCTEAQLPFVLAKWFAGQDGLMVVRFDPAAVEGQIVWEDSEPGKEPFPHLYGALPLSAARVSPA